VPFVAVAPPADGDGSEVTSGDDATGGLTVREGRGLADVAPTILDLVGVERPPAMTGEPLLEPRDA
jgi:2,3-bisphosphoglycerate-independent phosphoglycerate mutase